MIHHDFPGAARIFEFDDGRQLVQLFYNSNFNNYGVSPELVLRAFSFPKGTVRVELVPHIQKVDRDSSWGDNAPRWDAAVPITTLMRKLALEGDWFAKGGFYRLYDSNFSHIRDD